MIYILEADSKGIYFEILGAETSQEARLQKLQTAGKTLGRYLEFVKEEVSLTLMKMYRRQSVFQ